jgi:hypothetical protein
MQDFKPNGGKMRSPDDFSFRLPVEKSSAARWLALSRTLNKQAIEKQIFDVRDKRV